MTRPGSSRAASSNAGDDGMRSDAQRRTVRRHYRDEARRIGADKLAIADLGSQQFEQEIKNLNDYEKNAFCLSERRTEALVFQQLAQGLCDVAARLKASQSHSGMDLIQAIRSQCGNDVQDECPLPDSIDWSLFAKLMLTAGAPAFGTPGVATMLGPMEIVPKERKARVQNRQRANAGPCIRPDEVANADGAGQKRETDANIEVMFKTLRKAKKASLVALALNRSSFARTVENIFTLSFLVKDGRVAIHVNDDNEHIVEPRNAPSEEERTQRAVVNTQFIFRLDFKDWLWMKEQLPVGKELMPQRAREAVEPGPQLRPMSPIKKTSRNRARETSVSLAMEDEDAHEEVRSLQRRRLV